MINGSDETVHHELLPLGPGHSIADGCSRWSHVDARYKMPWNRHRWIAMGCIRCVSSRFNLDLYNSCDQRSRLNQSSEPQFKPRVSIWFKWRSMADIARAIRPPTCRHVASSSRSLIAIDRMALIAPRHLLALNILKNWYLIRKFNF